MLGLAHWDDPGEGGGRGVQDGVGHGLKQPLLDTVHSDLRLSVPRSEPCVHRQGASCDSPSNAGGTFSFLGLRMAGMGVQSEADTGS